MTNLIKLISTHFPWVKNIYTFTITFKKFLFRFLHPFAWYNLRNLQPVSRLYGLDRGKSIDRYYIEEFLNQNRRFIKGYCLEVADDTYTKKFGAQKVKTSHILDINPKNKYATVISDLRKAKNIKSNTYDCLILTQVFQFIDDCPAAIKECHRILKKGGYLLVTLPAISRADVASGIDGDYWRFTTASAKYLFNPVFGVKNTSIKSHGNVLTGTAFWQGIAWEELKQKELSFNDPNFPLVITVRAKK